MLDAIGYGVPSSGLLDDETRAVIIAFQRRFRAARVEGALDEETGARLAAVERAVSALRARRQS